MEITNSMQLASMVGFMIGTAVPGAVIAIPISLMFRNKLKAWTWLTFIIFLVVLVMLGIELNVN